MARTHRPHEGRFAFDDIVMNYFSRMANSGAGLLAAVTVVLVVCGICYSWLEDKGPIEGIWWAIVTGFTVGYGDQYPNTTPGRGLGAILIVCMFILALCLGARITQRVIQDRDAFTDEEQQSMKAALARIEAAVTTDGVCPHCGRPPGPA
ncbi:MAG: potassium channel family protein [Actinomycetes bacterium]